MASVEIPEGLEELFQQSLFDHVLHYALLVGAIFQLICIAAIVVLPAKDEDNSNIDHQESNGSSSRHEEDVAQVVKGSGGNVGSPPNVAKKAGSKKARKRK